MRGGLAIVDGEQLFDSLGLKLSMCYLLFIFLGFDLDILIASLGPVGFVFEIWFVVSWDLKKIEIFSERWLLFLFDSMLQEFEKYGIEKWHSN